MFFVRKLIIALCLCNGDFLAIYFSKIFFLITNGEHFAHNELRLFVLYICVYQEVLRSFMHTWNFFYSFLLAICHK